MQKIDLNTLIAYQEHLKENIIPSKDAEKYIYLSQKLLHKVTNANGILSGTILSFPEDCLDDDLSNYYVFMNFLDIIEFSTTLQKIHGSYVATFT